MFFDNFTYNYIRKNYCQTFCYRITKRDITKHQFFFKEIFFFWENTKDHSNLLNKKRMILNQFFILAWTLAPILFKIFHLNHYLKKVLKFIKKTKYSLKKKKKKRKKFIKNLLFIKKNNFFFIFLGFFEGYLSFLEKKSHYYFCYDFILEYKRYTIKNQHHKFTAVQYYEFEYYFKIYKFKFFKKWFSENEIGGIIKIMFEFVDSRKNYYNLLT